MEDNSHTIHCLIEGVVSSFNARGQLLCKTTATIFMMASLWGHQQVMCLASEDTISGTALYMQVEDFSKLSSENAKD